MKVNNKHYKSVWASETTPGAIEIIDQRPLPHKFVIETLNDSESIAVAIEEMHLRGAPLIGIVAAFGVYYALKESNSNDEFEKKIDRLKNTRPTAINLEWAINKQLQLLEDFSQKEEKLQKLYDNGFNILEEDIQFCKDIGKHGLPIFQKIYEEKGRKQLNVLIHCNPGWLATGDYGTATSPIYQAFDSGMDIHVYVDETRPRNQGSRLTAWELGMHGVSHTVISDNTGGHLMQHGLVDIVITGADRVTRNGDAANKIGTYLKALAAKDNNIPFYVALPYSTFDWDISDGVKEIPIEQRGAAEVASINGLLDGEVKTVKLTPEFSNCVNYGFDVTPNRLINGFITERGVCKANEESILNLYPEYK